MTSPATVQGKRDGRPVAGSPVSVVAFQSPSELASLSELLIRRVFGVGLLVSSVITAYATILSAFQPFDGRVSGLLTCGTLLVAQLFLYWRRDAVYELMRLRPTAIFIPALAVGIGGWLTGVHNEQYFFVLTMVIGVLGVAVSLPFVSIASFVAALGVVAPAAMNGASVGTAVFAFVVPPIFWLIVNRLAIFVLGLHKAMSEVASVTERPEDGADSTGAEAQTAVKGRPRAFRRQLDERAFSLHNWETQRPRIRRIFQRSENPLTARQQQTVFYCCDGLEDAEIAEAMSISVRQVRRNLAEARERTGSATREQLAAWAITQGLIP